MKMNANASWSDQSDKAATKITGMESTRSQSIARASDGSAFERAMQRLASEQVTEFHRGAEAQGIEMPDDTQLLDSWLNSDDPPVASHTIMFALNDVPMSNSGISGAPDSAVALEPAHPLARAMPALAPASVAVINSASLSAFVSEYRRRQHAGDDHHWQFILHDVAGTALTVELHKPAGGQWQASIAGVDGRADACAGELQRRLPDLVVSVSSHQCDTEALQAH